MLEFLILAKLIYIDIILVHISFQKLNFKVRFSDKNLNKKLRINIQLKVVINLKHPFKVHIN